MATTERSSGATGSGQQRGVSRVLIKLENSIEQGDYYEAHQMYRTLYFRYTTQKKYKECLELLFSGAAKLLTKQQQRSAADLCLLIVDTLEKRDANTVDDCNDAPLWLTRLGTLITGIGADIIERESIINRAITWSRTSSGNNFGDPNLHKVIAQVFWNERNIELARHHFLLSQDGNLCGRILIQINESRGFNSEADLFIVQAVLQQLCLKDRKTAEDTFTVYTQNHPQILRKDKPFKQPLLNFLYFLFRLIDLKTLSSFITLRKLYEPSLKRDPSFIKYLSKIGVLYFGETVTQSGPVVGGFMGGMFEDLISRLFNGFEDDDDDDDGVDVLPITSSLANDDTQSNELD